MMDTHFPFVAHGTGRAWLAVLVLVAGMTASVAEPPDDARGGDGDPLKIVRAFMEAFNAHDVEAMRGLLSPEASWYSVNDGGVTTEAGNRAELLEGMRQYFSDVPDVRSTIEEPLVNGSQVAFRERVTWSDGERGQSALAVYEVRDGRIYAAWYHATAP